MKQIWPNYSYSPATNVLTLTGLNIDRDQLLLVTAADRGRIMYNFADSSVTASAFTSGANTALTLVATTAGLTTTAALVIYYDDQLQSTSVCISNLPSTQTIAGTVTIGNSITIGASSVTFNSYVGQRGDGTWSPISLQTGSNYVNALVQNSVTISGGTVTIGAGTAQIGSVTASLAYSQTATTISSTAVTAIPVVFPTSGAYGGTLQGYNGTNTYIYSGIQAIGNTSLASATSLPVSLTTLPALVAGTAQIGSVTASISGTVPISISSVTIGSCVTHGVTIANTVVTFYPAQGTTVSNTNFTSITSSTSLVAADSGREVLTVFNEGAGNLHISPGATCTTISYQVRLSSGDYWECPAGQLSLAHTAVFATAGTARVTQVS